MFVILLRHPHFSRHFATNTSHHTLASLILDAKIIITHYVKNSLTQYIMYHYERKKPPDARSEAQ